MAYHSPRQVNVISTRGPFEMAVVRGIPLHLIPAAGVTSIASTPGTKWSISSVTTLISTSRGLRKVINSHRVGVTYGYTLSKWANEVLLKRMSFGHSLLVCIPWPSTKLKSRAQVCASPRRPTVSSGQAEEVPGDLGQNSTQVAADTAMDGGGPYDKSSWPYS